jgi:hypothetical protein
MRFLLIDRVIQEGFNVYNMYNIVEKLFSIIMAPVQSRGGWLIYYNIEFYRTQNLK